MVAYEGETIEKAESITLPCRRFHVSVQLSHTFEGLRCTAVDDREDVKKPYDKRPEFPLADVERFCIVWHLRIEL